jgi:hypothetical protein
MQTVRRRPRARLARAHEQHVGAQAPGLGVQPAQAPAARARQEPVGALALRGGHAGVTARQKMRPG